MTNVHTSVDRELLLEFLMTFSCFEYALKTTGFFVRTQSPPGRPPDARPDWDSFAVSLLLQGTFNAEKTGSLREACEYIRNTPPNKQVIINGTVAWETPVRPAGESDIQFLLRMVRSVRNNLFHGGKHNIGLHESRERTETLLKSCLTILRECLALAPDQSRAFREAVL
jgi:hypothetical protein